MGKQYIRYCKLIVQKDREGDKAFDFSPYRIVFNISQAFVSKPCTADIRVYNVPKSIVEAIKEEGQYVILDAGYVDNHAVIFKGQLIQRYRGRENETDTFMQIVATSGDVAHNYGVVNVSLKAGATPDDVYNAVAAEYERLGVEKGDKPELPKTKLPRGKVIFKPAPTALDDFATTHALQWTYEGNRLQCVPIKGTLPGEPLTVNYRTGLIGMPEMTLGGLQVSMLLRPEVRALATTIKINNEDIQYTPDSTGYGDIVSNEQKRKENTEDPDGIYKVISREHEGDNRGEVWQTNLICVGMNATLQPVEGAVINGVSNE